MDSADTLDTNLLDFLTVLIELMQNVCYHGLHTGHLHSCEQFTDHNKCA